MDRSRSILMILTFRTISLGSMSVTLTLASDFFLPSPSRSTSLMFLFFQPVMSFVTVFSLVFLQLVQVEQLAGEFYEV